jgi:hypothetical protein
MYYLVKENDDNSISVLGKTSQIGQIIDGSMKYVYSLIDKDIDEVKAELVDDVIVISEDPDKIEEKDLEARGNLKMQLASRMRNYINGYNDQKVGVTEQEVVTTMQNFGSIDSLLSSGSLKTARGLIATVDITGTIYQEVDRTKFLAKIDELISIYDTAYPIV